MRPLLALTLCSICACGTTLELGYRTALKVKCEVMQKSDLYGTNGSEERCGATIETTLVEWK